VVVQETGRPFDENRMSLERFTQMMDSPELVVRYLACNVRPQRLGAAVVVLNALRALPVQRIRGLATLSVYGIWTRRR
jgi:hypothetical protein